LGEVMALLSGSGGLGKTALTAGLALQLAKSGKKVLCVDCQPGFGTLDIYLGMEQQDALSYADICRGDYPLQRAAAHPKLSNLRFLSAPVRSDPHEVSEAAFESMTRQAKQQFDFILLNTAAGLSSITLTAVEIADRCTVLCGTDPASIRTAGKIADRLQLLGKIHCRLVVSRVQPACLKSMKLTVDDIMDRVGLPLLGLVPEDEQILLLTALGKFHEGKKWAFSAYERISKRMQGQPVPVPTR
jgi:septum site-determining protein MinD